MLHLVAKEKESCPKMDGNVYIQHKGKAIGQYGANKVAEPPILPFDDDAEKTINDVFLDKNAKVYYI